ncbi:MAG: hypothetical protein ABI824_17735, partial [Acidobacteriota bacterium]
GSEHIIAIAQTRADYLRSTGAAEWSGGIFDGRIHIPVLDKGSLDPQVRQTLAHESVHACMAQIGQFPTWLAEGVAQKLSGAQLNPTTRAKLDELAKARKLPSLSHLARDWSSLDTASAQIAYALALRAVEIFEQDFSAVGLRNLLKSPERIPQIAADIDKRLGI